MDKIIVNIAKDYTKTPGGRYRREGAFSGEDFRIKILKPAFERFISSQDNTMTVILDGGYGYAPSFLEEAFGGLARETRNPKMKEIKIVSDEEPELVFDVTKYINKELGDWQ